MTRLLRHSVFLFCLLVYTTSAFAERGKLTGEEEYVVPNWFKESFLEIQDDISDAKQNNKHLLLFMHIDRCPYCTRMLEENFISGETKKFIDKHFDVIALNIRGDREIHWDNDTVLTEKSLARKMNAIYTPTLVFLDSNGNKVYQMNGYRKPAALKHVLDFVNEKQYTKMKLSDYVAMQNEAIYQLRSHPLFRQQTDFSKYNGPLAIIFEDRTCADCKEFHEQVLNNQEVLAELEKFRVVRLDALSEAPIIDTTGKATTPKQWAQSLGIDYRPGTILFAWGDEAARADGRLYHFHFKELLRYVSGGHYELYPNYIAYLSVRQKQLLDAGINIDVSQ